MRTIRVHVDMPMQPGATLTLPAPVAAHVVRVLRLKVDDLITLFNGDGHEYPARLVGIGTREVIACVDACVASQSESPLQITLVQALARGEKMDWIVQKSTELGVARIVPVETERSEVKLDGARAAKRVEHWQAVAIAACEQSGRSVVPPILAPRPLAAWLGDAGIGKHATRLVLHPQAEGRAPRDGLQSPQALVLAVGPEGGFGERDLASLHAAGFHDWSLGPRILRTETAGLAAIAILQARYGDL